MISAKGLSGGEGRKLFPYISRELLAGMVATFALIPEVIAFSFVAGIDPEVGLYASFVIGIVIAFFGGRPAMISAAAGSVALVAAPLIHSHGLPYLLAAGLLAGLIQIVFGLFRLSVLMRFVASPVRTGFVNALAILIFSAQLPQIFAANMQGLLLIIAGLGIIYGAPRIIRAIPSPLIAIVILTLVTNFWHLPVRTVADLGRLPLTLPHFTPLTIPFAWESLQIIFLPALAIAMVGLLESIMTAFVADDLTDSNSNKNRESLGLGMANIAASLFGGIAGCGMIGQTVGNIRYGGRGRLSTFAAGAFLMILILGLRPWVSQIPVAALVAIMLMVSVSTFNWQSIKDVRRLPKLSAIIMLTTVLVTVFTHNLAAGVLAGVLLSSLFFSFKIAALIKIHIIEEADSRIYQVKGQVFYASADMFIDAFEMKGIEGRSVTIDLTHAHLWDVTAVEAFHKVQTRFRHHNVDLAIVGLNQASAVLIDKLDPE
ncbi:MAG: SulP family inorganic anion transporter [Zymomonas mobilis subsp. pomaceae]|uniref:Sulphate transporter n=1 Tax=Zymomonas mobilis subsp. pomaceae (strain ATCC 29192 / DSM 22645 / JCM 10191 / CCUG 17912 / NBRC 13757 / NCIMB 11200 / NRRL B-4491 / Barker I) TaxID=579138 RepID=F8ERZ6_ZYMMT|nr:SulP family inorganic anion transporter [Zymomonas mobilis]AEI37571.1 sulphate transporter [Zymomonas mobilis subsp. pomaceae ATCC 29192]MDX5948939.1 SulP family inorganic anion transporter [Zymomonas mobilis subsp. pomaceae]GEB88744.1 sodium-independent anion transporter [Zymomonas mobilis subsp. pomaceae]